MSNSISNRSSSSALSPEDGTSPPPTESTQEKGAGTPLSFQGERLSVINPERREQHHMQPLPAVPAPGNTDAVIERGRIRQVFHTATRPFVSLGNITGSLATRTYRGLSSLLNPQSIPRVAVTSLEAASQEREMPSTPRAIPVASSPTTIPTVTSERYIEEIYPPGPLRDAFNDAVRANFLREELQQAIHLSPLNGDRILARSVHHQLENLTNSLNRVSLRIQDVANQHSPDSQRQAINNLLRAREQLSEATSTAEAMLEALSSIDD